MFDINWSDYDHHELLSILSNGSVAERQVVGENLKPIQNSFFDYSIKMQKQITHSTYSTLRANFMAFSILFFFTCHSLPLLSINFVHHSKRQKLIEIRNQITFQWGGFIPIDCRHGWEYDKEWFENTAVSQENWVCEKDMYQTNTFAYGRLGEVIGSLVFGQLGDW